MESDLIAALVARGMPVHIAQGIVANMIAESRLDPGINEIAPLVPGSRGGFGLNQWTGPRRVQYEQFARDRGARPDDWRTQLDFTLWELGNTERGAGEALRGARDAEEAARIYSERFLRPGIPNLDRRLAEARRLASGNAFAQVSGNTPKNAFAYTLRQPSVVQLDPADYQMSNAFAPVARFT